MCNNKFPFLQYEVLWSSTAFRAEKKGGKKNGKNSKGDEKKEPEQVVSVLALVRPHWTLKFSTFLHICLHFSFNSPIPGTNCSCSSAQSALVWPLLRRHWLSSSLATLLTFLWKMNGIKCLVLVVPLQLKMETVILLGNRMMVGMNTFFHFWYLVLDGDFS